MRFLLVLLFCVGHDLSVAASFCSHDIRYHLKKQPQSWVFASRKKKGNGIDDDAALAEDLAWRSAKIRLEEAHTESFIKKRPWKLPYNDARKWVQRNFGVETKAEFNDLVYNGNLRTAYIPKRPEEYYKATGEWVSWDDFLNGDCNNGGLTPVTGKFD